MEKGKLGLRMSFYTVSAFVLAYLGYSTVLFLMAGVVLIVEQDEWATRQVIQAICLCLANNLVSAILGVFSGLNQIPLLGSVWGMLTGLVTGVIGLCVLVFALLGILRNLKGEDANIPGANRFADWAYGVIS